MAKAGPYIKTARAKATPGRTVASGGTVVIKKKGKKPLSFKKGGLHRALGVPEDQPIPASKKAAALSGKLGKRIKRMAVFAFRGALKKGRQTAAEGRRTA